MQGGTRERYRENAEKDVPNAAHAVKSTAKHSEDAAKALEKCREAQ
jgi:hypothetical protein